MDTVRKRLAGLNCQFNRPYYHGFLQPEGALTRDPACHALMCYALQVKVNLEAKNETIKYEESGDLDLGNYKQLWVSTATSYGVEPEEMVKYWPNIDAQLAALGSPTVPEIFKMRSVLVVGDKVQISSLILPKTLQ